MVTGSFPPIFIVVDRMGTIVEASHQWLDLFQSPAQAVIGRPVTESLAEDSAGPFLDCLTRLDRGSVAESLVCEVSIPSRDPLLVTMSICRKARSSGHSICVAVPVLDDAILAELANKSFRIQACLEGTNAGTWEWNIQTGEARFNERWAEFVGYRLDELGETSIQTWLDFAHPEDLKRSQQLLEAHWSGKTQFYDFEARMRHKDGRWVWVHDRGRVFSWTADGKPEWMFGTHVSIDEQKTAALRADRFNRIFRRVEQMAGVGGWELDLATEEIVWTDQTRKIHGVPESYVPTLEEAINFYAPEARQAITDAVQLGMTKGHSWDLELPMIRANGDRIWVRAVGEVLFEGGKPRRLFGAFQDITARLRRDNELREARDWMRLATASGGVGLWSLDTVDSSVTWDEVMAKHFLVSVDAAPGTLAEWMKLLPRSQAAKFESKIRKILSDRGSFELEIDFLGTDGVLHSLKLAGEVSRDAEGLLNRIHGTCFNMTPERRLMFELQEQTSKLSVTLSSIGDGVITTDRNGHITWINQAASRLTGWAPDEAIGKKSYDVFRVFEEDSGNIVQDPVQACLAGGLAVELPQNSALRRKNGEEIAIDDSAAPIIDLRGRAIGSVIVFKDVSKQRKISKEITYRATHDLLTQLLNRSAFEEQLAVCLEDPVDRATAYLLFVDLDHFKRINDSLGHAVGDTVLQQVARCLCEETAEIKSAVARQGGDEFALLTRLDNEGDAYELASRICSRIAELSIRDDLRGPFRIGASVGVVHLAGNERDVSLFMRRADVSAYTAKASGRGQVRFWSETDAPLKSAEGQVTLAERIQAVTAKDTWVVFEQPIAACNDAGRGTAMRELLIRMPLEDGTLLAPNGFLETAERYGLMPDIDLWMFRFCVARLLEDDATGVFCVNLSPISAESPGFQSAVLDELRQLPRSVAERMCFEITETSFALKYASVSEFLRTIKELGVLIAIDDFGAGASSFRYFTDIPADFLKIDGGFVQRLHDPVCTASVECFVKMADIAGLKCIAEHVETKENLQTLARMGIDLVQGFAIAKPRPVSLTSS